VKRAEAEEMCRQLATWNAVFDEAARAVVETGASPEERHESLKVVASLMASLYVDVARPVLRRFPELDEIFAGTSGERQA
jgi:hypothetical protein